jgi:hypothetical protein
MSSTPFLECICSSRFKGKKSLFKKIFKKRKCGRKVDGKSSPQRLSYTDGVAWTLFIYKNELLPGV